MSKACFIIATFFFVVAAAGRFFGLSGDAGILTAWGFAFFAAGHWVG